MNKKLLSLFSGCGGMDLGFEGGFKVHRKCINTSLHPDWIQNDAGADWVTLAETSFKTIFANDIRPGAKAAWVPYFQKRGMVNADAAFHLGSIVDYVKAVRENSQSFYDGDIDIVTGGFPCQDFSVAGKRKGFASQKSHTGELIADEDDPTLENRGMLYMWMREVIDLVRPKMFIAENVKGLVSLSNVKQIIEKDFQTIGDSGYLVIPARVLKAPEYGIPQSRERVLFIGFRRDALTTKARKALEQSKIPEELDPYPLPTHRYQDEKLTETRQLTVNEYQLFPRVDCGDVLRDLPEPENSTDLSQQTYSKAKWYGKHCQGQTEINLSRVGPTIRSEHHGNIEYRRLSVEHGGRYLDELDQGMTERRLTIRECARIQTFPDDFEFVRRKQGKTALWKISGSEAYKLIGNAVPPLLAYHLAQRLDQLWSRLFKSV